MSTQSRLARSIDDREASIRWDADSPIAGKFETRLGTIVVRHGRFQGGTADGVEVVEVDTGGVRAMILPTRGMAIWYLETKQGRIGWESPVRGPVHPSLVPVWDPSGLGWLAGFDELFVRCGLESNGAPEHDATGRLVYPLHGCVGNLPADSLSIEFDEASGRLELIGEIQESRLFFKKLKLRCRTRFFAGRPDVEILDDVTNESSKSATIQMLYHINVGLPLLGAGSTVSGTFAELAPKDALSASEMDQWHVVGPPVSGYSERVYFGRMHDCEAGEAAAMLRDSKGKVGFGVSYRTATLPYFIFWKNPAGAEDGYVVGLEPATNLPNQRSFEAAQGRVVTIEPGETTAFRVSLHPLEHKQAVDDFADRIEQLCSDHPSTTHNSPKPGWSAGVR